MVHFCKACAEKNVATPEVKLSPLVFACYLCDLVDRMPVYVETK